MEFNKDIQNDQLKKREIIESLKSCIKNALENQESGHDFSHIERVINNKNKIKKKEKSGDIFIIELACLFHDIKDSKFNNGIHESAEYVIREFLESFTICEDVINEVVTIVDNMSYSLGTYNGEKNINFKIVQDADRIDALGAIGIARVFHYSGFINSKIYEEKTLLAEENLLNDKSAIAHFYNKLLNLQKLMNTKEGYKIAKKRTLILKKYLKMLKKEVIL